MRFIAALVQRALILSALCACSQPGDNVHSTGVDDKNIQVVTDAHGAIIRGDTTRRLLALVFTGDTFADGGEAIRSALASHQVKASFFLTGNFYDTPAFAPLIRNLLKDGHYLGAHSDKHLLYADWSNRDSLLVTREAFRRDLEMNYVRMEEFGIRREDAAYFLPPYEWYNAEIARWTAAVGMHLINFSPGTRAAADYTFPEMENRYVSSDAIYQSILRREESDPSGLNGFILLLHIGTDPRRTDKFYHRLDSLIAEIKRRGYRFATIPQLLDGEGRTRLAKKTEEPQ